MATILIVDDSEAIRSKMTGELRAEGYEVLTAVNGEEGLEAFAKAAHVDVIICDISMPRMDGLSFCKAIREGTKNPNVSIFVITTDQTATSKERAKKLNIRAFITKPYPKDRLLSALRKIAQEIKNTAK